MLRKTIITVLAFLGAIPALAHTTQFAPGQAATGHAQPVLRLMNDREFAAFLVRLDSDLLRSEQQLEKMDVKSLSLEAQDKLDRREATASVCNRSAIPAMKFKSSRRNKRSNLIYSS